MDKQFFFFNMSYEQVRHIPGALYRTVFIPIAYVGMHWHKEPELILVLDGSVTVTNSRQTFTLRKGDLIWINASEVHSLLETQDDNLLLVLQFDPDVFSGICSEFLDRQYDVNPECPLEKTPAGEIRSAMTGILALSERQPEGYALNCTEMVYTILSRIRINANIRTGEERKNRGGTASVRIKQIVDYLNSSYRDPVSLESLADHFRLSPFHISHIISEQTGFSFQEHLNFIRLHHAVDLMMTTDLRLIDISMEAGFSDPKYMNKYFHRLFGMNPSEMRKQENWKSMIRNRFGQGTTDLEKYGHYLEPFL
jgi:xylan 1,4-beta-xylosidase